VTELTVGNCVRVCAGVVQEVEYVKAEDKLARLAECLQKTAPPVLVFAEKTRDVDMVHEYLLTRGVNAVAIHGARPPLNSNHCSRHISCVAHASHACVLEETVATPQLLWPMLKVSA
jgi:hypothetical protein